VYSGIFIRRGSYLRSLLPCPHRMEWFKHIFHQLTDVETLVRVGGVTAMTIIVFAETGLLVGFFLPGDSLLVTAGVFAGTGQLNIVNLNLILIAAAILGDTVGYWFGRKTGPALFNRPKSMFFNPAHLKRAHDFYEKHGGKTIVLARFIPVVRTFAPFVAGVSQMSMQRFQLFTFAGAFFWVLLLVLLGFFFGNIPFIRQYLNVIVLVGIGAAIVPVVLGGVWKMLRKDSRGGTVRKPNGG